MMTKRFARLPLRYKMTLPTWLLFTVIFICVGGAAIKVISLSHYDGLHGRIKILSQGVASTLQAALTFADAATAKEQLNILTFDPDIIAAQVKSTDLLTKAAIHRLPQDCYWDELNVLCRNQEIMSLSQEIVLGSEVLGELEVWVSLEAYFERKRRMWLTLGVIAVTLSFMVWWFARVLHNVFVMPLTSLHRSMEQMSRFGVLKKELPIYHDDELGKLTHCFNEMVISLRDRESDLQNLLNDLEARNRYIQRALGAMRRGVLVVSENKTISYFNPAAQKELKIENEGENIAQRLEAYYEPKMAVDALMHSIVNGCKGKAVELRARDGERRYRVTCHPMSEGKETLVQFEDISEAYLAEQRRKLIDLMFEQNQDAILVLSRTFSVETQNLTSLRWFGEVHRLEEIHDYDSLQFTQAELKALMKSGGLIRAMEVKCQGGSLLPCQLKLRVLKSTSGRVEAFVVTLSDLSVERELKRLNYVANHDPLTGLANRSHAFQSLQSEHDQGKDQYLLFLDLDGFKAVNDQFGHAIGDDLLRVVAKRLKNSVFNRDLVARLAGDEFLIGIRDAHTYVPVVERILEQLQQPISIDGCLCDVTASIGVSHWAVKDGVSLEERIHHADEAMYVAKRLGKNQYCCLQDELTV
ncbi:diguanylate cyclase [Vibrio vulnificus]|uniref:diguanylate cyclase domain-containing protein n=1 Tax=Vibrio vulnificus TaxID=672 RepID=UPI001CDB4B23|nr:diguanylate cyclase [Vibrio vulnificus]MCA3904884.1 diguanylate cyclase [Vibrio vulnificus]